MKQESKLIDKTSEENREVGENSSGINDDLSTELKRILDGSSIPQTEIVRLTTAITKIVIQKSSIFSGPIPPPELLKEYNIVIPDGAERILKMAENQSQHRIKLEETVI